MMSHLCSSVVYIWRSHIFHIYRFLSKSLNMKNVWCLGAPLALRICQTEVSNCANFSRASLLSRQFTLHAGVVSYSYAVSRANASNPRIKRSLCLPGSNFERLWGNSSHALARMRGISNRLKRQSPTLCRRSWTSLVSPHTHTHTYRPRKLS